MPSNQFRQRPIAPWYLWAIGLLALLWNGFGVILWAGTSFMPDTFLKDLPVAHREYVSGLPLWSTITWGLGVLGGTVGAILLLLRHPLAVPAFGLSLVGAVTNTMVYVTNPPPDGFFNLSLTVFIIGVAVVQLWFARRMKQRVVL
jgi:hypothetical protein